MPLDKIVVKAKGILAPTCYNVVSGEYEECDYLGNKPKVISVWPGVKAVYIPPELNENPNVEIYADLNKWEAKSNLEAFKEEIIKVEGKKIIDFADWVCPFLGKCEVGCMLPIIKPEIGVCMLTKRTLADVFDELGITHKEIYLVREQLKGKV